MENTCKTRDLSKAIALFKYSTSLRDIWRIVKKKRRLFLLAPVIVGLAGALFAVLKAPPPLYNAVCKIQFDSEILSEVLPPNADVDAVDAQLPGIRSYAVIRRAAEKTGLMTFGDLSHEMSSDTRRVLRLEALRRKVSVQREPSSDHVDIRVTDGDPALARRFANTLAAVYLESWAENRAGRIASAIEGIDAQWREIQQRRKANQVAFETFSRDNRLLSIELQSENLLKEGQDIREQLRRLTEDERELKRVLSRLRQFIKRPEGSDHNFSTSRAGGRYEQLNRTLEKLSSGQDSNEPSRRITRTAEKMAALLSRRTTELRERMSALEEEVRKNDKETGALLEQKLTITRLKKQIKTDESVAGLLERRKRELLIRRSNRPQAITIVRPALWPKSPVNPPGTFSAALYGGLIGLFLALAVSLIQEAFRSSQGDVEDVERGLGLRVLGVIPKLDSDGGGVPERGKIRAREETGAGRLGEIFAVHYSPDSAIAENFRLIRTRILSQEVEGGAKTFLVTSPSPDEGKTLVAVNMAVAAAQSGMKTLLVEADLRRPVLAGIFQIETSPGFVEVLVGDTPWEAALKTVTHLMMGKMTPDEVMKAPGLDNLHIMTSGEVPSNPSPLLESERLADFVKDVEAAYDLVIFDAPHVLAWNDATILATKIPAVLLVYRPGDASKRVLKRVAGHLEQVGCRLLGVILNGIRPEIRPIRGLRAFDPRLGQEKKKRRPFAPRVIYIPIALLVLGAALLWYSGLIDSLWRADSEKNRVVMEKRKMPQPAPSETVVVMPVERIRKAPLPDESRPEVVKPAPAPLGVTVPGPQTVSPPSPPKVNLHPPAEPEEAEEVLVREEPVFFPYALYLGSFRNMGRVDRAVSIYREKGVSTYWVRVYFKEKGLWFRLYTGHFENAADAEQFMRRYALEDAEVKHTRYANLIEESSDSDAFGDRIAALESKGYAPYIIGAPGRPYRLYVGAYLTRAGAERQRRDLEADGIAGQVVER